MKEHVYRMDSWHSRVFLYIEKINNINKDGSERLPAEGQPTFCHYWSCVAFGPLLYGLIAAVFSPVLLIGWLIDRYTENKPERPKRPRRQGWCPIGTVKLK